MPQGRGIYDSADEPDEGEGSAPHAGSGADVDVDKATPDVITPEGAEPTD